METNFFHLMLYDLNLVNVNGISYELLFHFE
jgi:hypothetical protein